MNIINDMLVDKCFPDVAKARAVVPAYKDKTASGNPITLTDSAENKPLNMKLYGWSKQDGDPSPDNPVEIESAGMKWSTGAQLFDKNDIAKEEVISPDGGLIAGARFSSSNFIPVEIGTYTISATGSLRCKIYDENKQSLTTDSYTDFNLSAGATFEIVEPVKYIRFSYENKYLNSIMLNKGDTVLPYEPYTGGIPKPYGDKVRVSVRGKNLFGGKALVDKIIELGGSYNKSSKYVAIDSSLIDKKDIYVFPDATKRYTIMLNGSNTVTRQESNILVAYDDGTDEYVGLFVNNQIVYYTNANKKPVKILGAWYDGGIRLNYESCGIFEGALTEDDFEPYRTPQSTAIVTPSGLPGIPVPAGTAGITYTDSDGQAWIADEIDLERGKYVQRVWKGMFDGSDDESWKTYDSFDRNGFQINGALAESITTRFGLCNQRLASDFKKNYINIGISSGSKTIYVPYESHYDASIGDKGLANFKAYLADNPLVVMTYLNNQIERDLTSTELAEYTQLYSYKPTTIVENDSGCWMDVTYKVGTSGKSKNEALRWYFKNVMPLVE